MSVHVDDQDFRSYVVFTSEYGLYSLCVFSTEPGYYTPAVLLPTKYRVALSKFGNVVEAGKLIIEIFVILEKEYGLVPGQDNYDIIFHQSCFKDTIKETMQTELKTLLGDTNG